MSVDQIRAWADGAYKAELPGWAWSPDLGASEVFSMPVPAPSEQDIRSDLQGFHEWIDEWRAFRSSPSVFVSWVQKRTRTAGVVEIPSLLKVHGSDELAQLAGRSAEWQRTKLALKAISGVFPQAKDELGRLFQSIGTFDQDDLEQCLTLVEWITEHPGEFDGMTKVPGISGRWFIRRRANIERLVAAVKAGESSNEARFRVRVLNDVGAGGGVADFIATASELNTLRWTPRLVLICEDQGLFESLPNDLGFVVVRAVSGSMGGLRSVVWLRLTALTYLGDVSTRGFAGLAALRADLPTIQSFGMTRAALGRYADLLTSETSPIAVDTSRLNEPEIEALRALDGRMLAASSVPLEDVVPGLRQMLALW